MLQVDDEIAITSTSLDPSQLETATIASILNGTRLSLSAALNHSHWGGVLSFNGSSGPQLVDARAEVSVLSRNVLITGGNKQAPLGRGPYIHISGPASADISNIYCHHCGQVGVSPVGACSWQSLFSGSQYKYWSSGMSASCALGANTGMLLDCNQV